MIRFGVLEEDRSQGELLCLLQLVLYSEKLSTN